MIVNKKIKETVGSVEIEGSTVEEAVNKAVQFLHVPRNCVNVKVVCEEKRGLFGMEGAKPAKVKVTIKKEKA